MNRLVAGVGLLLIGAAGAADAAQWRMDAAASRLTFSTSYQGEAVPGAFKQFDARLRFDPARPAEGHLEVTVELDSFDMGNRDINDAVREPDWFDLKRFPQAEFRSQEIRQTAPGRFVAQGTLRIKGAQQPVAVPFVWEDGGRTATMKGEVGLKRNAFGIGAGEWASGDMIGLDVKVVFSVRLQRAD